MSPLYQYICDKCLYPYEIQMTLKDKDKVASGEEEVKCPECGEKLRELMCPPKIVRIN